MDHETLEEMTHTMEPYIPKNARLLDLMSGSNTYVPKVSIIQKAVGVGLSAPELGRNINLNSHVVQDLNSKPALPFKPYSFDIITVISGMSYVEHPTMFFRQAADVLKPGGTIFIAFSNEVYKNEATEEWYNMTPEDRLSKVVSCLAKSRQFSKKDIKVITLKASRSNDPKRDVHIVIGVKKVHNLGSSQKPTVSKRTSAIKSSQ
ncbi:MAG: methyltransferase domain-containing protein [Elusimicrobia bacterium]|nr:methyltransferase domain-containing protein [Elusimicrobiota bacterium]